MSNPVILMSSRNAISSRESEAGHTPSASPDGRTTDQSGQEAALVSRFRAQAKDGATMTTDISGQLFTDLSRSLGLQQSLASRLRARLGLSGSLLFRLTWKHATMLSGLPLLRQRASARGTSDRGSIGWPTPKAHDGEFGTPMTTGRPIEKSTHLATIAKVAGWGTPMESDKGRMPNENLAMKRAEKGIANLSDQARIAGWITPAAHFRKRKGAVMDRINRDVPMYLDEQAFFLPLDGAKSSGSIVPTENRGQLNPAFVRHLMGYPPIWDATAPGKARGAKMPLQESKSSEDTGTP